MKLERIVLLNRWRNKYRNGSWVIIGVQNRIITMAKYVEQDYDSKIDIDSQN